MVCLMGPLYGMLFGQSTIQYIVYLSVSFVLWTFISTTIIEASQLFIVSDTYIKQIALPFSFYIYRLIARNGIIFFHNSVLLMFAFILSKDQNLYALSYLPIGILLLVGNLIWITGLLAILGARYRDINQLVINFVQICFFLSPIMWKAEMLPQSRQSLLLFNPLYHLLEVVRAPILGNYVGIYSYVFTTVLMLLGMVTTLYIFARFRNRIAYWI
jgi:lipopolysaccharide transport system permease protein